MTGAELKTWRERHGLTRRDLAWRIQRRPQQVAAMECGRASILPRVAAYVAAYPVPPVDLTYPLTGAGLVQAMRDRRLSVDVVAAGWHRARQSVWRWQAEYHALPLAVRAWLRAGAPWPWQPPAPPPPLDACLHCGATPVDARGRCHACYQHFWRYKRDRGPHLLDPTYRPPCRVCGETSHRRRRAYCQACYIRAWRQQRISAPAAGRRVVAG